MSRRRRCCRRFRRNPLPVDPKWLLMGGAAIIGVGILLRSRSASAAEPGSPTGQPEGSQGLPENATNQQRFGPLYFVPDPQPNNPEAIRITNNWDKDNIVSVQLPELGKTVQFNKRCAGKLQQLVNAWAAAGVLGDIVTWDGTYVSRFIRGSRTLLSPHTFGISVDINAAMNPFRQSGAPPGAYGSMTRLVEIARNLGWNCGADWPSGQTDAMHLQIDHC